MTNVNHKTVKLNTGKMLHDFIDAPFKMVVERFEVVKGVGKLIGKSLRNGVEIELVTFNTETIASLRESWGTKVKAGYEYEGLLPYREWTGRYNVELRHQLYLDARGASGEKGVYELKRHTAEPVTKQEVDIDSMAMTPEQMNESFAEQESKELIQARQEQASQLTCACRKTKTGVCYKVDAKKYH